MDNISSFGIIGGDKRQLYCGKSAIDDGYGVYISGFEKCGTMLGLTDSDIKNTIRNSDAFILPLPVSKDGLTLNAPLADNIIQLDELFEMIGDKPVFCGMKTKLPFGRDNVFDYSIREEFAVANAVPTSEGAVETSDILSGLGADVTVSARNLRDIEFIKARGFHAVFTNNLTGKYDIIFNTIPCMIFDSHTLAKVASNALVIDLASMPGGVDLNSAERLGIKAVHALSLPGKVAPKTSGIIIKNAVYNIIREEKL